MARRAGTAALCVLGAAVTGGCGSSGPKAGKAGRVTPPLSSVSTQAGVTNLLGAWGENFAVATADVINSAPAKNGALATVGPADTMWSNTTAAADRPASARQLIDAAYIKLVREQDGSSAATLPVYPSPALYRALQTLEKTAAITVSNEPSTTFSFFLPSQADAVMWQRKLAPLLPQHGRAATAYGGFLYVAWPAANGNSTGSLRPALNAALGALASQYTAAAITRVLGAPAAQLAATQAKSSLAASVFASTQTAGTSTGSSSGTTTTGTTT